QTSMKLQTSMKQIILVLITLCFFISCSQKYVVKDLQSAKSIVLNEFPQSDSLYRKCLIYQWPFPLQKGDTINEAILPTSSPISITSSSYFYFVDYEPGAYYNHTTAFVLINRKTGAVKIYSRASCPSLNGMFLFSNPDECSNPAYHISGLSYEIADQLEDNYNPINPSEAANSAVPSNPSTFPDNHVPTDSAIDFSKYRHLPNESGKDFKRRIRGFLEHPQTIRECTNQLRTCNGPCNGPHQKLALVIEGGEVDPKPSHDAVEYLRHLGYTTMNIGTNFKTADKTKRNYPTTLPAIDQGFKWLSESINSCCDEVIVLINGHGSPDGKLELNPEHEVPQKDDHGRPTGKSIKAGSPKGGFFNTDSLKHYFDMLRSCDVKIFLQTCYGGSHLENGINALPDSTNDGCLCRLIVVSSTARQTSRESGYRAFVKALKDSADFEKAALSFRDFLLNRLNNRDYMKDFNMKQFAQISSTDNRFCADEDGDGLTYGEEIQGQFSDPGKKDTDGDGLSDGKEKQIGTNPRKKDSDDDGVLDKNEVNGGTNPNDPDTDNDGINDGEEYRLGTSPNNADTDDDGVSDGLEIELGTNPLKKDH
ncbi:MAG TPA: hypothetical protein VKA27_05060, partial [Sunxiuqinia sp.]|nr:hypothetical protein [Sunxiuqinia sp.]